MFFITKIKSKNEKMKTASFFIVAVILGIMIEKIVARYLLLNLDQVQKDSNITGKMICIIIHDCVNFKLKDSKILKFLYH